MSPDVPQLLTRYGQTPLDGLPERVTICEVGPRDGLQNESAVLPVEVKAEFIARLADAGHTVIETTSFVHPKWVPQLADAGELLAAITPRPGVRYPAWCRTSGAWTARWRRVCVTSRCSAARPKRSPSAT